ncbi:MAG: hypothetical protein R2849_17410 [Thermomicrobiales bacterium]
MLWTARDTATSPGSTGGRRLRQRQTGRDEIGARCRPEKAATHIFRAIGNWAVVAVPHRGSRRTVMRDDSQ